MLTQVLCFLVPFVIPLPIMGLGLFAGMAESSQLVRVAFFAVCWMQQECGALGDQNLWFQLIPHLGGKNIHLPAIFVLSRVPGFWPRATLFIKRYPRPRQLQHPHNRHNHHFDFKDHHYHGSPVWCSPWSILLFFSCFSCIEVVLFLVGICWHVQIVQAPSKLWSSPPWLRLTFTKPWSECGLESFRRIQGSQGVHNRWIQYAPKITRIHWRHVEPVEHMPRCQLLAEHFISEWFEKVWKLVFDLFFINSEDSAGEARAEFSWFFRWPVRGMRLQWPSTAVQPFSQWIISWSAEAVHKGQMCSTCSWTGPAIVASPRCCEISRRWWKGFKPMWLPFLYRFVVHSCMEIETDCPPGTEHFRFSGSDTGSESFECQENASNQVFQADQFFFKSDFLDKVSVITWCLIWEIMYHRDSLLLCSLHYVCW